MGRSDPHIMSWYGAALPRRRYERVAILGATRHNHFTASIDFRYINFFDLTTNGWNINDPTTDPSGQWDLIVCTRCPYFSDDPVGFLTRMRALLNHGGLLFVDWGLGDHWRIDPYKIGWRRDGESESIIYGEHVSMLHSTAWSEKYETHSDAQKFLKWARQIPPYTHDARSLTEIIADEVPQVLDLNVHVPEHIDLLALWPESPQLYIVTTFAR